MKWKLFAVMILAAIVLVACSGDSTNEEGASTEGETENIKELVHDYSVGNINDQSAAITSQQLIVTDSNEKEVVYDLPEEEFFVSIAPYINETHP